MTLYNVNLQTGECLEEREVFSDHDDAPTIDEFVAMFNNAADGLTDAKVTFNTDTDAYEGFVHVTVCVTGKRQLTEAERNRITAERDRERRFQDHMAAFRG